MTDRVLVTGGAGFIGSHLTDTLIEKGYQVRIFDNLAPQVHGPGETPPPYLNPQAELVKGDMRHYDALKKAMKDINVVFHLAAAVGVGQSMYQIKEYVATNSLGTANLLDILVNEKNKVSKLIVASSMSVYGEGKYECNDCGPVYPQLRSEEQLRNRHWEPFCPGCGKNGLLPLPTDEAKPPYPTSIYAISKLNQEDMCLTTGRAYKIPTVALRFFNVYGERQALSNPYTGVGAIFSARLLNKNAPIIYEDGLQRRDFIYVKEVARAGLLVMKSEAADYKSLNVGTGEPVSIIDIARKLASYLQVPIEPEFPQKFRAGDIRHCFADISAIRSMLGFAPEVNFAEGVKILAEWVRTQTVTDRTELARRELEQRGLAF